MDAKKRIKIFNNIRDIPYYIPLKKEELIYHDYSCMGKSRLLFKNLKKEYKVRYRTCTFRWSNFNLPKNILEKINIDEETHYFIEAFINNKWITLDASLDKGLEGILKINYWDGRNNTNISLPYYKLHSPEESLKNAGKDFNINNKIKIINQNYYFFKEINRLYKEARKINSN